MKQQIYRNLHKQCWSVKERGKKVRHATQGIYALTNCSFLVQPAGNRKVREQKKKNVHAYISGFEAYRYLPNNHHFKESLVEQGVEVTYNPYKHTTFVIKETGEEIFSADIVLFTEEGKVFAIVEAKKR